MYFNVRQANGADKSDLLKQSRLARKERETKKLELKSANIINRFGRTFLSLLHTFDVRIDRLQHNLLLLHDIKEEKSQTIQILVECITDMVYLSKKECLLQSAVFKRKGSTIGICRNDVYKLIVKGTAEKEPSLHILYYLYNNINIYILYYLCKIALQWNQLNMLFILLQSPNKYMCTVDSKVSDHIRKQQITILERLEADKVMNTIKNNITEEDPQNNPITVIALLSQILMIIMKSNSRDLYLYNYVLHIMSSDEFYSYLDKTPLKKVFFNPKMIEKVVSILKLHKTTISAIQYHGVISNILRYYKQTNNMSTCLTPQFVEIVVYEHDDDVHVYDDALYRREFLIYCVNLINNDNNYADIAITTLYTLLLNINNNNNALSSSLSMLVFSTSVLPLLLSRLITYGKYMHDNDNDKIYESTIFHHHVCLFNMLFEHLLLVQSDDDFMQYFNMKQLHELLILLRYILFLYLWKMPFTCNETFLSNTESIFILLRERETRNNMFDHTIWIIKEINQKQFINEFINDATQESKTMRIIKNVPFVLPFDTRVKIFSLYDQQVKEETRYIQPIDIKINRTRILQDGFRELDRLGGLIKGRLRVHFVDEHGMEEAGVDGGGLFKEFLISFLQTACDPLYGLFSLTEDQRLYCNANIDVAFGGNNDEIITYYVLIGRMIGKALYDGIQVNIQFALFFLMKLLGMHCSLNDLLGFDPELHKNLTFLKTYEGNYDDLELYFTISSNRSGFGESKVVELEENGMKVKVDKSNVTRFIYKTADYVLNKQTIKQTRAFMAGINEIIPKHLLRLFTADELQQLISGTENINLTELQNNIVYSGGYSHNHELIRWFWEIMKEEFKDKDKQALLKFTTSCPRAPLQGFSSLEPRFCIQRVGGEDQEKLPTSSTCMNLLRLPRYNSKDRLKKKLLYAIHSNAGFGLS